MKQKIGIQGIKGSFHHQVALEYFGQQVEVLECMSFSELVENLQDGKAEQAVMAIENSIAGSILPNYALIDRHGLRVTGEHYLPIHMNLMALPGQQMEEITEIWSHPIALLQCRTFFEAHPQIRLVEDADTAEVAQRIASRQLKGIGAVAGPVAAEMYGLEVLAEEIHSVKNNATRFLVLSRGFGEDLAHKLGRDADVEKHMEVDEHRNNEEHGMVNKNRKVYENGSAKKHEIETYQDAEKHKKVDKVSLKFELDHVHGSLASILNVLNEHKLNLTKIQSLPIIESPWRYAFFIDVSFDVYSDYQEAYEILKIKTRELKVIGEYKNNQP